MTPTNRLEQMIRRLTAQRNCLVFAAEMVADLPGPVLEFGLGKARTYDFMRERLPEREIYVFERVIHCRPEYVPAAGYLLLGDVRATVPAALARLGEPAARAHFDICTRAVSAEAPPPLRLPSACTPLIRPRAAAVRGPPHSRPRLEAVTPPLAETACFPSPTDSARMTLESERGKHASSIGCAARVLRRREHGD